MFATQPDRTLLNPKFEGYKLDAKDEADILRRYPLEYKPKPTVPSGRTPLSFREVQSRIRHNHLVPAPDGRSCIYIDSDLRVVQVRFNDDLRPIFAILHEMPIQIGTELAEQPSKDFASATFVDSKTLFVTDGAGTLFVLALSGPDDAPRSTLRGTYELPSDSDSLRPFRIHTAAYARDGVVMLIVSSAVRVRSESTATSSRSSAVEFDVYALEVALETVAVSKAWHLRGADAPLYVDFDPLHAAFLFAGSEPYRSLSAPPRAPSPLPTDSVPLPSSSSAAEPPAPPPYAWTQDDEEVTVAIPLPASTSSSSLTVLFTPQALTIRTPSPTTFPTLSTARLWAPIAPSSSFWTWDAAGAHTYGLLTLHIEKTHARTRWPSLFADGAVDIALDVPETLDASALAHIRDAIEKFHADASAISAQPVASIDESDRDRDDDMDADAGASAVLTWAQASTGQPPSEPWSASDADGSLSVLSTPLPGSTDSISLVTKHTIDGLLFARDPSSGTWTHERTHPALAFVLASKRDARFVYHVRGGRGPEGGGGGGVVALESGAGAYGGNAYIYRATGSRAAHAPQGILRVAGAGAGALLGVAAVRDRDGSAAVACLCESELVVLRGML